MNKFLTQETLKEIVVYDASTGFFTWAKDRMGPVKKGSAAGGYYHPKRGKYCYHNIHILGVLYQSHRLAWLYMTGQWPHGVIDHINGNGMDNRWVNLRDVTIHENYKNSKISCRNTSGSTGVMFRKDNGKWRATIGVDYKKIPLGQFETFEDAVIARKEAEIKYGFHENHGRKEFIKNDTENNGVF